MSEEIKRYDIIRVDKHCPNWYQSDVDQRLLCDNQNCISCDGCRYGHTKQQLIKIIAQILKTTLWNEKIGLTYEQIAQKIFEGIVNEK